jgi:hypothetical protein
MSKAAMQRHLDGCKECAEEASLWHRVASVAKRQQVPEPPAHWVRSAKALMGMENLHAAAKPTVAKLLFDSLLAPAAAGTRSAAGAWPRQLLFGVGDHRIDLRIEPKIDLDKVAIMGQVLDSAHPDQVFSKIPVSLHLGKRMLACAETNGIGEFELECDLRDRLELRAVLPHGQLISLWLVEPATTPAAEPSYPTDSKQERKASGEGQSRRKRN